MVKTMLREYLEKYAGDEYVYISSYMSNYRFCTVVCKLYEKSTVKQHHIIYYPNNEYRKISNCEIVDIVLHDVLEESLDEVNVKVSFTNGKWIYHKTMPYKLGDFIDGKYFIIASTNLDLYMLKRIDNATIYAFDN